MTDISGIIKNIQSGHSSAHAYIVEGRSKSERDDFINELTDGLGCHPLDVVHMQMSGKAAYKVDDAGAFSERLGMGAYGGRIVGIIDDADALSETVQNKLLKTLEEPDGSALIILGSSNRDHLLETVRSRCSVIRLQGGAEGEEAEAAIREAASLALSEGSAFCEFREALEKSVKTASDAMALIDAIEDELRERMLSGEGAQLAAAMTETAEKARMDIEKGMDKNKALKRLRLELSGL